MDLADENQQLRGTITELTQQLHELTAHAVKLAQDKHDAVVEVGRLRGQLEALRAELDELRRQSR